MCSATLSPRDKTATTHRECLAKNLFLMNGWMIRHVKAEIFQRILAESLPTKCVKLWTSDWFLSDPQSKKGFLIFEIERLNFLIMRAELLSRTQRCFFLFLRVLWERGNAFHSLLYCYLMVSYHYEASVRYDLKAENNFK